MPQQMTDTGPYTHPEIERPFGSDGLIVRANNVTRIAAGMIAGGRDPMGKDLVRDAMKVADEIALKVACDDGTTNNDTTLSGV